MTSVLEAVPNFSEGRDLQKVRALVDLIDGHDGVEVLDWSADHDHHRCVVTYVGEPGPVERASVAAACWARDHIDLRRHDGVHPRIGALDVLPLVPLVGLTMDDAVASSRRVGAALAAEGIPVFYYGASSTPPGRGLAELRRGGVEALGPPFPADRRPDEGAFAGPHPTAGATCVGARRVLLAWNVYVEGVTLDQVRALAARLRERGGGFPGLRALGLHLERADRLQVSMNLEDPGRTPPMDVFRAIEEGVGADGGRVTGTEVIGMLPDALVLPAAGDRLQLPDISPARILSVRVPQHLLKHAEREAAALRRALEVAGDAVPGEVRDAALRLIGAPRATPTPDDDR